MATKEAQTDTELLRKRTAERAYALWEAEGKPHGRHLDHWCQAEAEATASGDTGSTPNPQQESTASNETQKKKVPSQKR